MSGKVHLAIRKVNGITLKAIFMFSPEKRKLFSLVSYAAREVWQKYVRKKILLMMCEINSWNFPIQILKSFLTYFSPSQKAALDPSHVIRVTN
jgi:hypothetical protein